MSDQRGTDRLKSYVDKLSPADRVVVANYLGTKLDLAGRTPPHSEEAEAAVVSAIFATNGRALDEISALLPSGEAMYVDAHRRIFDVARELHGKGQPVDIETVHAILKQRDQVQAIGGIGFLAKLIDASPAIANVAAHARIVAEKYRVRRLIETCQMVAAEGFGDYGDASTFCNDATTKVSTISESAADTRVQSFAEIGKTRSVQLREQWEGKREPWGMRGPHARLHALTHGHGIGEQTYVAGETGGGKSVYALQSCIHLAQCKYIGDQIGAGYISLEVPKEKQYDRGILHLAHPMAIEARVRPITMVELQTGFDEVLDGKGQPTGNASKQRLSAERVWLIEQAEKKLQSLAVDVDDAGKDLANIRATGRLIQRRLRDRGARLRLLVIDHMHIMKFPDARREDEALAMMVSEFNNIARELEVHLMVLAQYNRSASSTDGPPRKQMIRGSAAIEQIAHKVFLIYRPFTRMTPQEKAEATDEEKSESHIIVDKHRDGREGTVSMRFTGAAFRFDEVDNDEA